MAALPPALSTAGRDPGSKKPFSYCPGGIDFSELKSPKIARRIAKHQAGASTHEPSSTLPPPAKVSCSEVRGEDGHTCHCQAATPGLVPATPPPARHAGARIPEFQSTRTAAPSKPGAAEGKPAAGEGGATGGHPLGPPASPPLATSLYT